MLEALNRFARLASARSEVVGASLIILMIVMMVIPLNPAVIDVLLAVNISICILLVISAVLIETPLAFSSFPAILLLTTLFRLALTISTTRLILLEADAGHIIQTFGEFVVGGNVAVGLTIFLIISVVNFLVVTKGSERVAEVAARFSLDGMPGKQMSIDSDLRAGMITQSIAKKRRADLEKESQLFGAMDGAIKFVKNDAIAGLVITVINLLGGLTVGMLQMGMTFSDASQVYTILSVGDGLVAIIPSLMVSIAAGLIVTRVTKGEADGANVAQDMINDLCSNSNALQISGIICLLFALVPGMPSVAFILIAACFFAGWFFASKAKDKPVALDVADQFQGMLNNGIPLGKMEDVLATDTFAALEVRLPISLEPTTANLIQNMCRMARNRQIEHLGILIPLFEYKKSKEEQIEFLVYGVNALEIDISDKRLTVYADESTLAEIGHIEYVVEKDNVTGKFNLLCDPSQKPLLDQHQLDYETFETRLIARIEALLVQKVDQLFTLNEYQRHITNLGEQFGEQVKELERILPTTKVVAILQRLMSEQVSIKNFRSILNSLIEWGQRERDPAVITDQVRRSLHEQICRQHTYERTLKVFVLSVEFEQLIRESIRSDVGGAFVDIDASSLNELIETIESQVKPSMSSRFVPAIICSMDCRVFLRQIIQNSLFVIPVFSHQEISQGVDVEVLGSIVLDEKSSIDQDS